MTDVERLLTRLRRMGLDIPEGSAVRRTYAGKHQRAAGAWSWYLVDPTGRESRVGSQYPVGRLLGTHMAASRGHREQDVVVYPAEPGDHAGRWDLYWAEEA